MNTQGAIAQLERLKTESKSAMRRAERKIAERIVADAKALAPGSLPNKIFLEQANEETIITGGDDISAYVEFGTGSFAKEYVSTLTPEVQEEALKFFVNGEGKGSPQPFFFPAIFRNIEDLIPTVEEELRKLAK